MWGQGGKPEQWERIRLEEKAHTEAMLEVYVKAYYKGGNNDLFAFSLIP